MLCQLILQIKVNNKILITRKPSLKVAQTTLAQGTRHKNTMTFSSKVIVRRHTHTYTHTIEFSPRTTKIVSNK